MKPVAMPALRLPRLTPRHAVTVAAGLLLVAAVTWLLFVQLARYGLPTDIPAGLAVLGFGLHVLSHCARALRLAVLARLPWNRLGPLAVAQLQVNGVNLLLPFKLGEAYRVAAFQKPLGGYYRSFTLLLLERIADFSAILGLLLLSWWLAPALPIKGVPLIAGAGVLAFGGFLVSGPLVRMVRAKLFGGKGALDKGVGKLVDLQRDVVQLLEGRAPALLGCTVLVWALEVGGFVMFWQALGGRVDAFVFLAAAVFLSGLLPGGPAGYGGAQLAFYWVGSLWALAPGFVNYSLYYNLYVFVPAMALAGMLFGLRLLKGRTG